MFESWFFFLIDVFFRISSQLMKKDINKKIQQKIIIIGFVF